MKRELNDVYDDFDPSHLLDNDHKTSEAFIGLRATFSGKNQSNMMLLFGATESFISIPKK